MKPEDVKRWRVKLKMTQGELAEALGVSWLTVSAWERGKQQPPEYLELALRELSRRNK